MRTHCLSILFHDDNAPIYSCHFEPDRPGSKSRLATGGGDNNVRIWAVERQAVGAPQLTYLSTLARHTQAVNVVRFCPRGEALASAGDDGTVLLWVPDEKKEHGGGASGTYGGEDKEEKESWRVQRTCRSVSNSEIYDLAWSPDGQYLITGSMDNIARIFHEDGNCIRQIVEHSHYVQGVSWDPLNEFVATQSSDRSVHIYSLKTRDGQLALHQHGKITKMEMDSSRRSSGSPAPSEYSFRAASTASNHEYAIASPVSSAPGTPILPMNPPMITTPRRSSFGNSPSRHRSPSPSSSIPLPAVKHLESPKPAGASKSANLYHNESMTSFFRRLTFTPDGSLLITPAGEFKTPGHERDESANTIYIYTRAGLNKPPVAHLPGHKKPAIAVKCSSILYKLREKAKTTQHITIDTSSAESSISSLPPPITAYKSVTEQPSSAVFNLPYRIVYAVATQDCVLVYDTQQQVPLCIVSNLHYATFTDLTWSADGCTLIMTSTDGFCSCIEFDDGELGEVYHDSVKLTTAGARHHSGNLHVRGSPIIRPPSPSRSNSSSSMPHVGGAAHGLVPTMTNLPGVTAGTSHISTPPHTPLSSNPSPVPESQPGTKRSGQEEEESRKKRRIAPTLVEPELPQSE